MNLIEKLLQKSYYRVRIILTFGLATILLVILMSRLSYKFVKDLYLSQLSEKVNVVSTLIASQISSTYLNILQLGQPTNSTLVYFQKLFQRNLSEESKIQLFVFDNNFKIIVHSDSTYNIGLTEPRLSLNEKEIFELKINQSSTSLPFKGDDGKWYLWGFHRLNENFWLGLKENAAKLEKVDDLSLMFWYAGASGVIIVFFLSLLIAKSISRPIDKLVEYSSEIGKGNFNIPAPEGMQGEIKDLAIAMDKMKNDLSENQKEKEQMLAQIAHEIRNPLGGIELLAGLTKEDLQKENLNTEYIENIQQEVNGLKNLITSFLEYSRPMPANPSTYNLSKIVDEVLDYFKQQIDEKKITVKKSFQLKNIYFDKGQLKQVIINLVANSIQAIDKNGNIIICSTSEKGKWKLSISDDGPGIDNNKLSSIFEPFYTTKKNGTGLGLATSKKLCIENRSLLSVSNNEYKGCTFAIMGDFDNEA
ncbi:MAG: ATP-binding protein [Ignavibacteria bacterium]|jgi:signal transduction histidine kinase